MVLGDRGGPLGCLLAAQSETPKALLWGPWGESRCKAVRSVCTQSTRTIRRDLGCWPGSDARFWLPWARSRAKRKSGLFQSRVQKEAHRGSLLWTRSLSGLFSFNILLQEKGSLNPDIPETSRCLERSNSFDFHPTLFLLSGVSGTSPWSLVGSPTPFQLHPYSRRTEVT